MLEQFAQAPMKKRHLLSSCDLSLPCVCACSLLNRVRICQILLSLGRRSWFFLSSPPILSPHLLTSFGDEGAINIADVHSWLPTTFIVSYMPLQASSYYALKSDAPDSPVNCGTVAMWIVHIAQCILHLLL